MWVTEFKDYKSFLRALIKSFPKRGFGQISRLADHLNVQPMIVTHILSRDRDFTPEQAIQVAEYFGFDERQSEYFLNLVLFARASSKSLKKVYTKKLEELRRESENIKNLVQGKDEISDLDKATYYSDWIYSAVFSLSAIKGYQTIEAIAGYFKMSRARIGKIVSFLVETGICVQDGNSISNGKQSIHVGRDSQFLNSHRRSWRDKAREKFIEPGADDLFYSSPCSLSEKDAAEFRKELLNVIQEFSKRVQASQDQKLMCLNIDWFEF